MAGSRGVPTNLITGFLGVGKTTALLDLLRRRPAGSRWAVIVNEYGDVGIDQAILGDAAPGGEVDIREVAGGCICCTSSLFFKFVLAQILAHVQPERILVETTGVGHPSRLLDELRAPAYSGRIDMRATIGIIAPCDFTCPEMIDQPVFRDQVQLADVLVLNKADRADAKVQEDFLRWGQSLFPPKLLVAVTQQGQLDPNWLDLDALPTRVALFPEAHAHASHEEHHSPTALPTIPLPPPGQPHRKESVGLGHRACGWVFSPEDLFSEGRLLQLFAAFPQVRRMKGVFHTEDGWIIVNRSGSDITSFPTQYCRDSRIEVFADDLPGGWDAYQQMLMGCLITAGTEHAR